MHKGAVKKLALIQNWVEVADFFFFPPEHKDILISEAQRSQTLDPHHII